MAKVLHVFSGTFGSLAQASLYSEEQWERPAPDDSWPEEEYAAWENRNPTWLLCRDLNVGHLDSDFIETIFGTGKLDYLESQLANEADGESLRTEIPESSDTLVLILDTAFETRAINLNSTPQLKYHGGYLSKLGI